MGGRVEFCVGVGLSSPYGTTLPHFVQVLYHCVTVEPSVPHPLPHGYHTRCATPCLMTFRAADRADPDRF